MASPELNRHPSPLAATTLLPFLLLAFLCTTLLHGQMLSSPAESSLSFPSGPSDYSFSTSSDVPAGTNENWQGSYGVAGTEGPVRAMVRYNGELIVAGQFRSVAGGSFNYIARWDGSQWNRLGDGLGNGTDGPIYSLALMGDDLFVGGQFSSAGGKRARNIASYNLSSNTWSTLGEGIGGGNGTTVLSLAIDGRDLYVGGNFVVAGSTVAVNIARWDGTGWHRVGTGINRRVDVLGVDDGFLYAGGAFNVAGDVRASRAARFNLSTSTWQTIPGLDLGRDEAATAFAFDETYVYMGGRFLVVDQKPVNNIARMNKGTGEWSDLDQGITNQRKNFQGGVMNVDPDGIGVILVRALEIRGDDLFVGGDFDNLVSDPRRNSEDPENQPRDMVKWNRRTETWSMFPRTSARTGTYYRSSGVINGVQATGSLSDIRKTFIRDDQSTVIYDFETGDDGSIYIAGEFDVAGPSYVQGDVGGGASAIVPDEEATYASNLTLLSENDTLWSSIGGKNIDGVVRTLTNTETYLYAGGTFERAGTIIADHVARFNRTEGTWEALGGGVTGGPDSARRVNTIVTLGDHVYVGGEFERGGGVTTGGLAEWNQTTRTWSRPGTHPYRIVTDMRADGNNLIVVGDAGLGLWNGISWQMIPDGPNGKIYAVEVYGDSIVVGGTFSKVGGSDAENIALWNRREKRWEALREGLSDTVFSLDISEGRLYAGGAFLYAGGKYSRNVASWDLNIGRWEAVGQAGLLVSSAEYNTVHTVRAGRYGLYVGGLFSAFGESPVTNRGASIILWDGSAWRPLGNGVTRYDGPGEVFALEPDSTTLFVGGDFHFTGARSAVNLSEWVYPKSQVPQQKKEEDVASELRQERRGRSGGEVGMEEKAGRTILSAPDDGNWDDRFGPRSVPPGTNDEIFAMASDGSDVVVGGTFTQTGLMANGIALWNGSDWEALGDEQRNGVNGFVFDILIDNDNIYVAGQFSQAGGVDAANIAIWNRTTRTWKGLGSGITGDGSGSTFVSSLTMKDGRLYAGGNFQRAGGTPARSVACWDGATWTSLGEGIEGTINALRFYQGKLFVGGTFGKAGLISTSGIAWWGDEAWHAVGNGVEGSINDFDEYEGRLIMGGAFRVDSVANLAALRSDLTFRELMQESEKVTEVRDLLVDSASNRVYVGGSYIFTPTDSLDQQKLYQGTLRNISYNFHEISPNGIGSWKPWFGMSVGTDGPVNAMALSNGQLVAGGQFSKAGREGESVICQNIARYDTRFRRWRTLLSGQALGTISALALLDGQIFAIGPFTEKEDPTQHLNEENHIARLGSRGWNRVDGVIDGDAYTAITVGDQIIYGGAFITSDDYIGVNLATYIPDSSHWAPLSSGNGVADRDGLSYVNAIAEQNGTYYIGGAFSVVDTFETSNIAMFNRRTGEWHPLGDGFNEQVWALALDSGSTLYAGGEFRFSGSRRINGLARWNGSEWEEVGGGVNGTVKSLRMVDGMLYVGGTFTMAGSTPVANLAIWDSRSEVWRSVGNGVTSSFLPSVESMAWEEGKLFVGGFFDRAGDIPANNIARWDGSSWSNLGSGTNHAVWSIIPVEGEVYVAGPFRQAGGKESPYVGLWHDPTLSVDQPRHRQEFGSLAIGPNPVRTESVLNVSIPHAGDVDISICHLNGTVVDQVVKDRWEPGEHRVYWTPPAGLANGIYLCRLRWEGTETVARLILY